jgi:hypothetical protein|tara:strand:+ start:173 stop:421 length:249 start_codon:yes stop_codon:yes gene_type:complete
MKLPKIPNSQLTSELKELLGDSDLEFDSIVSSSDIFDIGFDPEALHRERILIGKEIIESRKKQEQYGRVSKERHSQDSKEIN